MIPILFEKTEKAFTSQGLGCLSDAISCKVTEERNGSFELEMEYPVSGIHYKDIQYSRIILAKPSQGEAPQPFEIYKITRPMSGKVTIYGEHISYRLSYTATLPSGISDNAQSALNSLKAASATDCPFTFYSDVTKRGNFQNQKVQSIRSLLGGQTGSILDVFGGEYKWDKWAVNLLDSRGSTLLITLEYGKNLTDLKQEENIESTYTAVIAVWNKTDDDDGINLTTYSDIVYTDGHENFPYPRTFILDSSQDFENQPSKAELTNKAKQYISANGLGVPKVSIDVSFVNLKDSEEYKDIAPLQEIHLCDTIKVKFSALGVSANAKVNKTVFDVLTERYSSISVGDARSSFAGTVASISQEIEENAVKLDAQFKSDLKRATEIITGNKGGYVVIRKNEQTGYPEEILIMDQPDKETAKNVIRMNKNGIGFSQNGYNGPFNSAWTIDGTFNASYIGAGIITAITLQTSKPGEGVDRIAIEKETSAIKGYDRYGNLVNLIDIMNDDPSGGTANLVVDAKKMIAFRSPKMGVVAQSYGTAEATVKECATLSQPYITSVAKNMNYGGDGPQGTHEGYVFDGAVFCTLPVYLDIHTSGTGVINGMVVSNGVQQTYTI